MLMEVMEVARPLPPSCGWLSSWAGGVVNP